MGLTLLLSVAGCALLFLGIWGVTVTMPTGLLAKNFPKDVQEKLGPTAGTVPAVRHSLHWIRLPLSAYNFSA